MALSRKTQAPSAGLTDRRGFLRLLAALGVGGRTLWQSRDAWAAVHAARAAAGADVSWPEMQYRVLGRTGFRASRLVFGCGAALSRGPRDSLLDAAWDAGINVFDVGYRGYYDDAERNLAPFVRRHRDEIFLISKARVPIELEPDETVPVARAREGATAWLRLLDDSLRELSVERVDAYYLMASYNPSLVASEEIGRAFERAKQAGKVGHLGLSSHQNARRVLQAAVATERYDLAMLAITPAGWYDWAEKKILADSKPMTGLRPVLEAARASGMGLVGMKAGRYIAGRRFLGWGRPDAFDEYYDEDLLRSGLSPFQRSYAYVLAHGLDCVNADMQSFAHLRENVIAATHSSRDLA